MSKLSKNMHKEHIELTAANVDVLYGGPRPTHTGIS